MKNNSYSFYIRVLFLVLVYAVLVEPTRAVTVTTPPMFVPLRDELLNQLVIASNAPVRDKRLLASLKGALSAVNTTKSNYLAMSQSVGSVAKKLNNTSVSNVFAPILQAIEDSEISDLMMEAISLSNRLAVLSLSKPKTLAQTKLLQLLDALQNAGTNDDVIIVANSLKTAAKNINLATVATRKAEEVKVSRPPTPRGFYFTATTNPGGGFNSGIGGQLAGVFALSDGILAMAALDPQSLNPQRDIIIGVLLPTNASVPFTIPLGDERGSNAKYRIGETAQIWQTTDRAPGTLTITEFDTAQHIIGGAFSFTAPADPDSAAVGVVEVTNGRFRVQYRWVGP